MNIHKPIVVRSALALFICVLSWLCVRAGLALDQLHQDVIRISINAPEKDLPGFLWQHPFLLVLFAVSIALSTLAYLAFSKLQCRAVVISATVIAVLLVQWLIITPAVEKPANDLFRSLERFTTS